MLSQRVCRNVMRRGGATRRYVAATTSSESSESSESNADATISNVEWVNFEKIAKARFSIRSHIKESECIYSPSMKELTGSNVYLKLELRQETGSFKERGACNALLNLSDEQKRQQYDQFGPDGVQDENGQPGQPGAGGFNEDIFSQFFGGRQGAANRAPRKTETMHSRAELTLEEIFSGVI